MAVPLTEAISQSHDPLDGTNSPDLFDASPLGGWQKRSFDIAIAITIAVLLSPLIVVVCCIMRVSNGPGLLYAHWRVGYGGRMFPCYKFRTMVKDTDAVLQRHLAESPQAAAEWSQTQKLRHDPRVTPVGRFLRRSSIDELPQILNVLRGDMSCVGPRPVVGNELARYGASKRDYLAVRPGLTGLWQVSGRTSLSYHRRVALDRYYVRHWSPLLDFFILLRTIPAVARSSETA